MGKIRGTVLEIQNKLYYLQEPSKVGHSIVKMYNARSHALRLGNNMTTLGKKSRPP